MGEALTTKAIAKKIKAAGLQKVRWYCQVCEKQCRDANGYKCHIESEAHQREIAIYQQNPGKFNDEYSRDFEKGFMDIVKRQYKNTRVLANIVYNEYIRDRNHTHLNATRWVTLTGFVMHLGKSGKCKVEESPKGWYISYVETDPEQLAKEEKLKKKLASEQDEETRALQDAEKRSKLAAELAPVSAQPSVATELKQNTETKIAFSFSGKSKNTDDNDKVDEKPTFKREAETTESIKKESREPKKKKLSAMEEILREEEKKKERLNRKDWWITEGIIVKIMNKELAEGQYYKQKGLITEVIDKYVAVIEMESGDMLKLDQSQLETVIPLVGGRVKVVNGAYRGAEATLSGVNVDKYTATIKLETGPKTGSAIEIDYEDICKLQHK